MNKRIILIVFIIMSCFLITGCENNKTNDNITNNAGENIKKKYNIIFDSDGGTLIDKATINENELVPYPKDPEKEGYSFLGWYQNELLFDFSVAPNSDLTLKAKWKEKEAETYIVSFDSDGGTTVEKQIIKKGERVIEPTVPTKENHSFSYWELNGKKYNFNDQVSSDIILKAKWKNIWEVSNSTFKKYSSGFLSMGSCYTEESVKANNYKVAKNVNIGDRIVCHVEYETNSSNTIKEFQYTLNYGSGLKLVSEEATTEKLIKNGNTYTYTLNKPAAVRTGGIGTFTFEVVGTEDITFNVKDIRFVTTDNRYLKAKDEPVRTIQYVWAPNNTSFVDYGSTLMGIGHCYIEGTVNVAKNVNIGDRIQCHVEYEASASNIIKSFQYTLNYGSGLKLVGEEATTEKLIKNGNTYTYTLNKPAAVRTGGIGTFTFEVVGTEDITFNVKDIRFVTTDNRYLKAKDEPVRTIQYVWALNNTSFVNYDSNIMGLSCYNTPSYVSIGDQIVCHVEYETNSSNTIKSFQYTLNLGSGLKLVSEEATTEKLIKNGNTYTYTLNTPSPVRTGGIGTFTFEVIGATNLTYNLKDIKLVTTDNRYLKSLDEPIKSFNYNS